MKDKVEMTLWVESETRERIRKTFPQCVSGFVRNCLKRALRDREFFEEMFFWSDKNAGTEG